MRTATPNFQCPARALGISGTLLSARLYLTSWALNVSEQAIDSEEQQVCQGKNNGVRDGPEVGHGGSTEFPRKSRAGTKLKQA